ncbi:phospholipid scramblase 2-like [Saccoglossus kowalevskii]|uniref:Phospholipid scramblase n=1 Tax=Saccoglossus kowalevskii TaxID=10224 RepID=A0ABM0LZT9_SACKO|nr:PREDICTED: phospholipid scramblase 2-like [Saccoglossus kowalevskii]
MTTETEVVQLQPEAGKWSGDPPPQSLACPPGLEYLTQIDQLLIHQQVELLEAITGWETKNKYQIKNSVGQQIYFAREETGLCMRLCCGPARGFQIHITDNAGNEVIRVVREFKCCAGCCWCANSDCCAFELRVEAPIGNIVGYVRQTQSCWIGHFDIMNAERETVLKIKGPCCVCQTICCTADLNFMVYSRDMDNEIGRVSKQWPGLLKEMFTDTDNFGVTFPIDLDVKIKATLLGAVFLIDFMYFEHSGGGQSS